MRNPVDFANIFFRMCALGLATEAAITLLTTKFIAFFLIPYIVVNVSVTVVPSEIQPWVSWTLDKALYILTQHEQFYKYGLGFPVANMSMAVRTVGSLSFSSGHDDSPPSFSSLL